MDTLRIDRCDRPLRVVRAVRLGDLDSLSRIVRWSKTLWGGSSLSRLGMPLSEKRRSSLIEHRLEKWTERGQKTRRLWGGEAKRTYAASVSS